MCNISSSYIFVRKLVWLVLLVAWPLVPGVATAHDRRAVVLGDTVTQLGGIAEFYFDPSGEMRINDVSPLGHDAGWREATGKIETFTWVKGTIWMRLRAHNLSPAALSRTLVLEVPYALQADLYTPQPGGVGFVQVRRGWQVRQGPRDSPHSQVPAFPVTLPAMSERTWYLAIRADGPIKLDVSLYRPDAFAKREAKLSWWYDVHMLAAIFLVIYQLGLYLIKHRSAHLWLALATIFSTLFFSITTGNATQLLSGPGHRWLWAGYPVTGALAVAASLQFSRVYLHTVTRTPRLDRALLLMSALSVFIAGISVVAPTTGIQISNIPIFVGLPLQAIASGLVLGKGMRSARWFFAGNLFMVLSLGAALVWGYSGMPRDLALSELPAVSFIILPLLGSLSLEARERILELRGQESLRKLNWALVNAEDKLRMEVAKDLHDGICQVLASIKIRLSLAKGNCKAGGQQCTDFPGILKDLDLAYGQVRKATYDLDPPVFHESGVTSALTMLLDEMKDMFGLNAVIEDEGGAVIISPVNRRLIYRMVRELLINAVKHGRGAEVIVRVRATEETLDISVVNSLEPGREGEAERALPVCREQPPSKNEGLGLLSIMEQVRMMGGKLVIEKKRQWVVALSIPLNRLP